MKHLIWNNNDANDSFDAEGDSFEDVLNDALSQLGWCVSEKPIEEEEEEEVFPKEECMMEIQSKENPNLIYLVKGFLTDSDFVIGDYKILTFSDGRVNSSEHVHINGLFSKNQYNIKLTNKTF